MKEQDNCSPSKANSTCIEEEIVNNVFKKIVKMINDCKEETQKLIFDFKEDMNKQMSTKRIQTNR
jgi:hypothetical protein